ncbi:unnamed protein product [Bursaphelenchus xylophilus]|uniref:(pine wood nematode) hypothetical protein n=1 Tax=Bursaphelenchus xylophilus TaxID=6326 RepID=A0A7I8XDM1_BURXY|nr:unnamed protein product [Bursaphelenchus xylophilus]CAG9113457.1 unnamed protein product [Bursaphelenchus xylophilus]
MGYSIPRYSSRYNQRLPRLRSRLLAPALSGSGSEPGAGAGNFRVGSGSRVGAGSDIGKVGAKFPSEPRAGAANLASAPALGAKSRSRGHRLP